MKVKERYDIILNELENKGEVKIADLAAVLGCSAVTIRTDIRSLDQEGLLRKTHGGAKRIEKGLSVQFIPGEYNLNAVYKRRICEKAYSYICSGDSILIDDSSTCCYLAQVIASNIEKKLTVVTNSMYCAALLSSCPHVFVYMLGGCLMSNPPSALDSSTVENISRYHVNKAFVGINGIDLRLGMTSEDDSHMRVKQSMLKIADESYVLADHTKFGVGGLFIVCPMNKISKIISDSETPSEVIHMARELDIPLDIV